MINFIYYIIVCVGMGKYPKISDDDFYNKVNTIYKRFRIPKSKKTFDEICFPKKFQLQLPQQFLSEYINPKSPYKGILIYHRIGAGKTCTAVRIAEVWKEHKRIIVVVPASLKGNFRNELRSLCANDNYLSETERNELKRLHPLDPEYRDIINRSDERIDQVYNIYSYNKFIQLGKDGELNLRNSVLIIDEIQNMVSESGTYYNTLYDMIYNAPDSLRIVLLSATPMFDKPDEIALTMNLLRIPNELPVGREFYNTFVQIMKNTKNNRYYYKTQNMNIFKDAIKGYVSYFRGAPPYVFPEMTIKYVRCPMSDYQYQAYKNVAKHEEQYDTKKVLEMLTVKDLPNNFYIGTRIVSNIVFPSKKINEKGFELFKGKAITEDLHKYSPKFDKIIRKVERTSGKIFIYSGFKEYGGIKSLVRVLEEFGYQNYLDAGEGRRRFAIWSGDETGPEKEEIRSVFNNTNNLNGSKIKVLIASPSGKEGLSLTAVRQVHVLEPYWNQARLDQIIGRASRFCSHKDVPPEKRHVKIYIYLATFPEYIETTEESVDEHIKYIADQKNKLIREFERAIKEAAIDCKLNKNANVYKGEEDIHCVD
jgi:superfamily II DNA or RNA helicase